MILDILDYAEQMLPLGAAALAVFLLLRPARKRRLNRLNLLSSGRREWALALFLVFCAGLAALTLFPANLWAYVFDRFFRRDYWEWAWSANGWRLADFYPSWEETASQFAHLPNMLKPFEEISRALNRRSYWLLFMLLGNIIMFMPLGFFPALLWRKWRWWKSLLAGFCTSSSIEFIQFFIGRSTDIDDVILNTIGAMTGFWAFCLLRAVLPNFTKKFQCQPKGGYYRE
ncbi:MAG: VanZ family protein [Lawsonibacter sp.]|nr:VanZ family protein [Lawsonibacter sp.]